MSSIRFSIYRCFYWGDLPSLSPTGSFLPVLLCFKYPPPSSPKWAPFVSFFQFPFTRLCDTSSAGSTVGVEKTPAVAAKVIPRRAVDEKHALFLRHCISFQYVSRCTSSATLHADLLSYRAESTAWNGFSIRSKSRQNKYKWPSRLHACKFTWISIFSSWTCTT